MDPKVPSSTDENGCATVMKYGSHMGTTERKLLHDRSLAASAVHDNVSIEEAQRLKA